MEFSTGTPELKPMLVEVPQFVVVYKCDNEVKSPPLRPDRVLLSGIDYFR